MRYPIDLHWSEEDKVYVAEVYDLPGCMAHGKTQAAAAKAAGEAAEGWLEVAREEGRAIPEPSTEASASGQLLLRIPKSLHALLRREAQREGVSLNQHLVALLAARGALWAMRTEKP